MKIYKELEKEQLLEMELQKFLYGEDDIVDELTSCMRETKIKPFRSPGIKRLREEEARLREEPLEIPLSRLSINN